MVPLVLLHRLYVHLLLRQQRLVAWGVTGGRQELEIAVASAQQEADPEMLHSVTSQLHHGQSDCRFLLVYL